MCAKFIGNKTEIEGGKTRELEGTRSNFIELVDYAKKHGIDNLAIGTVLFKDRSNIKPRSPAAIQTLMSHILNKNKDIRPMHLRYLEEAIPLFSKHYPDIVDGFYDEIMKASASQDDISSSYADTIDFLSAAKTFFNASQPNPTSLLQKDANAFYFCYKWSYRFRKEKPPGHNPERNIVKSVIFIKYHPSPSVQASTFEDRQYNTLSPTQKATYEEEITHGIAFAQSYNIILLGREIEYRQPRLFWLQPGALVKSNTSKIRSEYIQYMVGYCFEGYAKFNNPDGHKPGSFFSIVGLVRVPKEDIDETLADARKSQIISDNKYAPYTDLWVNDVWLALKQKISIAVDIDLEPDHEVYKHMTRLYDVGNSLWIDSNEGKPRGAK